MNRRKFLQGVAAIGVAALLPKVDVPEPQSGFDNWIASYPPQRAMTAADLVKGVEMLRKGWPDPGPWWSAGGVEPVWAAQFDPPLGCGPGECYAARYYDRVLTDAELIAVTREMESSA